MFFAFKSDMSYINVQFHWISRSSGVLIARFPCAIILMLHAETFAFCVVLVVFLKHL